MSHRPDEAAWLERRRKYITASEVAAAVGLNKFKTPQELWHAKVTPGYKDPAFETDEAKSRAYWGHACEGIVAKWFSERTGFVVAEHQQLVEVEGTPFAATLDALCFDVKNKVTVPLEIKTTSEKNRFHWVKSGPPIYYLTQLHVQMAAVGADHGYVAALFGGQQALYWRLDWNPVLWERIDRLGREFHQYVLDGEMPPADFATEPYDPNKELDPPAVAPLIKLSPEGYAKMMELIRAEPVVNENLRAAMKEANEKIKRVK